MCHRKKGYLLRLNPDLHKALQAWAEDEFRSLNGHLEYLLKKALKDAGRLPKNKGS